MAFPVHDDVPAGNGVYARVNVGRLMEQVSLLSVALQHVVVWNGVCVSVVMVLMETSSLPTDCHGSIDIVSTAGAEHGSDQGGLAAAECG